MIICIYYTDDPESMFFFFFFNNPAPTEISPLPLHAALPTPSETLDWTSWLPVLDPATATAEQQAVLDLSHPKARTSDFYLLLARQPRVLSERSQAFNAIIDRKSTRLNSSHGYISYAVFCLEK